MSDERLLPELWPLHRVAAELGRSTYNLVDASRRGNFPPVHQVGRTWFVKADAVRDWFATNHAALRVTPEQRDRIRAAGRAEGARLPARRQPRLRARSAASSGGSDGP